MDSTNELRLNTTEEIGKKFFELRDYTPIPLVIMILFFADASVLSATLGLVAILAGELFRIYSVAFIGKISRTRKGSTGDNLIKSGPFSWVRNPLYVGNFFISVGIAIYSGSLAMIVLTAALFSVQYVFIVAYEEAVLLKKFGQEYEDYRNVVPAWFPRHMPKLHEIEWPSSYTKALESEKKTLMAIVGMLLVVMIFS